MAPLTTRPAAIGPQFNADEFLGPTGFAFEELSICSTEHFSSGEEGRALAVIGQPERTEKSLANAHDTRSNRSPLSAAVQSCGRDGGGDGSGFPWKSATTEFTNPTRLKNEYGLAPLCVRGIERVALHADLTMLARLSLALARARAVPLAA
jgi:hypothetical protein